MFILQRQRDQHLLERGSATWRLDNNYPQLQPYHRFKQVPGEVIQVSCLFYYLLVLNSVKPVFQLFVLKLLW